MIDLVCPFFDTYKHFLTTIQYLLQYYNFQNDYTDCDSIVLKSSDKFPGTSLQEISQAGVPQQKLVLGKPGLPIDVTNGGYLPPDTLADCLKMGKDIGWNGGVMAWQYPDADANWIKQVRSKSWPVQ